MWMKKILFALALGLILVATMAVPATAAAQKLALAPIAGLTGSGFAVINSSSGPNNFELTVSLKGAAPNTNFEVYLELGSTPIGVVGTFTTNKAGNGNFHINMAMVPGTYNLGIDLAIGGADQYLTSNVYGTPILYTFE
jgi:hypothetical protein